MLRVAAHSDSLSIPDAHKHATSNGAVTASVFYPFLGDSGCGDKAELWVVPVGVIALARVDSQGAAKLAEILEFTESIDVDLRLARVKPTAAAVLARDGVLGRFAPDRSHGNVYRAVEAQLSADRLAGRAG